MTCLEVSSHPVGHWGGRRSDSWARSPLAWDLIWACFLSCISHLETPNPGQTGPALPDSSYPGRYNQSPGTKTDIPVNVPLPQMSIASGSHHHSRLRLTARTDCKSCPPRKLSGSPWPPRLRYSSDEDPDKWSNLCTTSRDCSRCEHGLICCWGPTFLSVHLAPPSTEDHIPASVQDLIPTVALPSQKAIAWRTAPEEQTSALFLSFLCPGCSELIARMDHRCTHHVPVWLQILHMYHPIKSSQHP